MDNIQEIKDRLDLVEFIRQYLKVDKAGINFRAPCPFHNEKTPSLFISPSRQVWKCFGCGEGGSIFDFVMKIEGIEFREALKILADRAGIEIEERYDKKEQNEKDRLYKLCDVATLFFEKQFESQTGKKAISYLKERGLTDQTIKLFRLGYAPDDWRALSEYLIRQGFTRSEIVKTGVGIESPKGHFDRFRSRIMFPVFDQNDRIIGFGGRIMPGSDEIAKYMNTPNTPLYDKSKILYGLNFAKLDIRRKGYVLMTEGYMDTILSYQAGFQNTIAVSGTALTDGHVNILKRYTDKVYTAFDMDSAGSRATDKSIDILRKNDFDVRVIIMPKGKDPADMILEDKKIWENEIENAKDIFDFYFEDARNKFDNKSPNGKRDIAKYLLGKIKTINNKVLQAHWIKVLSDEINTREDILWEELDRLDSVKESGSSKKEFQEEKKSRHLFLQEELLSIVLKDREVLNMIEDMSIFSDYFKHIFLNIDKKEELEKDEKIKKTLDNAYLYMDNIEKTKEEAEICISELLKDKVKKELLLLQDQIQELEKDKNNPKIEELIKKFDELSKKIN